MVGIEGAGDVAQLDGFAGGVKLHGDHVEAHRASAEGRPLQQQSCCKDEMTPLGAIHAQFGCVATAGARLHLGQHQCAVVRIQRKQVHLQVPKPKIACKHFVAKSEQVRFSGVLGVAPALGTQGGELSGGDGHAPV